MSVIRKGGTVSSSRCGCTLIRTGGQRARLNMYQYTVYSDQERLDSEKKRLDYAQDDRGGGMIFFFFKSVYFNKQ